MKKLGVVAAAVLALSAFAAKPPSVDDLVTKYVAGRGGLTKIRSVQSLRQKGHVNAGPGKEGVVTRELKRPAFSRFEFKVQGVTSVFVADGTRGWKVDPANGDFAPTALTDEAVKEAKEQGDFEGPLVDWKAKGHKVELVGREDVAGRSAYKLKLTLKSGAILYNYLDADSKNLVRIESTRQVRGRPLQMRTTFGNFKKTDGLLFPGSVDVEAAERPDKLHIDVESVEVNPALADARFAMPASIKR